MATYDFTGTNGDPLPAGWASVNGTFQISSNKAITNTLGGGANASIALKDSGAADITLTALCSGGGSASSLYGIVFRYSALTDYWIAGINSTGLVQLYSRIADTYTVEATYQIVGYSASTYYDIKTVLDGNDISVSIDDVERITFTSTHNNTATQHGFRFGAINSHNVDTFTDEVAVVATPFLTVDQGNYHSQQHVGGSRTVTFTGTHGNQTGAIHYKLNGGSAVVAVATPTGSTWTTDITLTEGNHSIEFFFADNASVTQTLTNVVVGPVFHVAGQSNASGFGGNNQTFIPNGSHIATFFGNNDVYALASDPFDVNTDQVRAISSYANAGGSWAIHFANSYVAGQNKSLCVVPNSIGSVGMDRWQKTDSTRIGGLNLYEAMGERIVLTGGCENVIVVGGETNIAALMTKTAFKALLNQFVDDVFADFGVKTVIVPFQTITKTGYDGNGTTTGQIPLRAAQVEVGNENSNAILVDPMTDIDLLLTGGEDGLHYITDAQKQTVGERVYARVAGSALVISITGIPDGTYQTILHNGTTEVFNSTLTYTSGAATTPALSVAASTALTGYVIDNEATHVDGAVITGTTA